MTYRNTPWQVEIEGEDTAQWEAGFGERPPTLVTSHHANGERRLLTLVAWDARLRIAYYEYAMLLPASPVRLISYPMPPLPVPRGRMVA